MLRRLDRFRSRLQVAVAVTLFAGVSLAVAPPATAACSMTAYKPYAASAKVWYGGTFSGCGIVDAHLRWAKPLGTSIIAIAPVATSGTWYNRFCDWGNPGNRNLYSRVETPDRTNGKSSTPLVTFNNSSNCKL